jgi:hypothetical protein
MHPSAAELRGDSVADVVQAGEGESSLTDEPLERVGEKRSR